MGRRQPQRPHVAALQLLRQALHLGDGAGDDAAAGRVEGGQGQAAGEQRTHLSLGQAHREHGSRSHALHQPPARHGQPQRVRQREDAGEARGHVLAVAVAQQRREASHPSPSTCRAREYSTVKSAGRATRVSGQQLLAAASWPGSGSSSVRTSLAQRHLQQPEAHVHMRAEVGLGLVQLAAHGHLLGALAGEEEGHAHAAARLHVVQLHGRRGLAQALHQLGRVPGHHGPAVLEAPAAHARACRPRPPASGAGAPPRAPRAGCPGPPAPRACAPTAAPPGEDGGLGSLRCSGASSRMAWALVPPMPKELTPARRGTGPRFHSRRAVLTKKGPASKSMEGLGRSKCRLGGISSWRNASAALMRPTRPATVSRWPMFVFTEPRGMVPLCPAPRP